MRTVQRIILLVGLVMLGVLLWKLDASAVWKLVVSVGWGFLLVIGQEIGAHLFNTLGWKFSFSSAHSVSYPFTELLGIRIVGDGVNYLTPSAQLAGEFARASLLNPSRPIEVRASSVVVAKSAQVLAQAAFIIFGIALFLRGRIPRLAPYEGWVQALAAAAAAALLVMVLLELRRKSRGARKRASVLEDAGTGLWSLPKQFKIYLRAHPGRFAASIIAFIFGFAWNSLEAWMICRFLGVPVSAGTAMAIEVLSCGIDGIFFMVPAKVGTQEAGKTAIFALLGLPAQAGLAFGVVRHIRELVWASSGLGIYTFYLRRSPRLRKTASA